ncbi:hypothetical protein [Faecalibacillus intestinalis]|uniref:hypothetical protein n=1 Tax=Faecalibacillus intestinalis TaxID=1982626 RepID=UPI00351FC88A
MKRINHNDAMTLERQVRRLYKCDRGGVSGLVDADNFEGNPICAAQMIVSYIYANGLESAPYKYDEFLYKYENIFNYSDEVDFDLEVKNYINDLGNIVDYVIHNK